MPLGEFKKCETCGELFQSGPEGNETCLECVYHDDREPVEPDEGDYTTEDHVKFWQHQYGHRVPVVVVPEGEDWRTCVKAHMDQEQFWPNVWFLSDHGNWHLLSLETESNGRS